MDITIGILTWVGCEKQGKATMMFFTKGSSVDIHFLWFPNVEAIISFAFAPEGFFFFHSSWRLLSSWLYLSSVRIGSASTFLHCLLGPCESELLFVPDLPFLNLQQSDSFHVACELPKIVAQLHGTASYYRKMDYSRRGLQNSPLSMETPSRGPSILYCIPRVSAWRRTAEHWSVVGSLGIESFQHIYMLLQKEAGVFVKQIQVAEYCVRDRQLDTLLCEHDMETALLYRQQYNIVIAHNAHTQ